MKKIMSEDARKIALHVLNTLNDGKKTLDSIVEKVVLEDRRDRAFFNALVYGVLRWRAKLDQVIAHFSKIPPNNIEPPILNILRLGLFQIMYMDRVPVSAAVNTSVDMAKSLAPVWTVRFVNGLLRNAIRNSGDVPIPDAKKNPAAAISSEKSFPEWLIRRWLNRLGAEETEKLCDAMNQIPLLTLRVNTLKISREELTKAIENDVENITITPYSPTGVSCSDPKKSISEMKAFRNGWFHVQDEAAQLVTYLLDPQPGEKILDACAGLGGKTAAIAQLMKNQGTLLAADKDERKLVRLEAEMKRLGVGIVKTSVMDFEKALSSDEKYDRILTDAPCSGLGVMQRNPDIKWAISKKNLKHHARKQLLFLENLSRLVKPGGILAYSVCSTEPEENEEVIDEFLKNHPEFGIGKDRKLPEAIRPLVSEHGYSKTFPHLHAMDGFFAVCLRKQKGDTR